MQVEIKLDPNCEQTRIVVVTAQVDEQIYDLVQQLSQQSPAILSGFRGEEAEIVAPCPPPPVSAADRNVVAVDTYGGH